jgi:hypothetical protein
LASKALRSSEDEALLTGGNNFSAVIEHENNLKRSEPAHFPYPADVDDPIAASAKE